MKASTPSRVARCLRQSGNVVCSTYWALTLLVRPNCIDEGMRINNNNNSNSNNNNTAVDG